MIIESTALPLGRSNVDTDQIIPARFLTTVARTGLGQGLFAGWRSDPDFELNRPVHQEARILLAGPNFGTGSSREHAVWALQDYGFRAVIAPSLGDIFRNNALTNGLLAIQLQAPELMDAVRREPWLKLRIDLPAQTVSWGGHAYDFDLDPFRKACLLAGQDDLGYLLGRSDRIAAFEITSRSRG